MSDKQVYHMEVEIDPETGKVSFNAAEFIGDVLSDEGRRWMLEENHVVRDLAYCEIERLLCEGYATTFTDRAVHEMRVRFLTGEDAPAHVRKMVKTLLREIEREKARTETQRERAHALSNYLREKHDDFGPHLPYVASPMPAVTSEQVDAVLAQHGPQEQGKE